MRGKKCPINAIINRGLVEYLAFLLFASMNALTPNFHPPTDSIHLVCCRYKLIKLVKDEKIV